VKAVLPARLARAAEDDLARSAEATQAPRGYRFGMRRRVRVPWGDIAIAGALVIGAFASTVMDAAAAHPLAEIIAVVVAGSVALRTVAPWVMVSLASAGVLVLAFLPDPTTPLWAFVTSLVVAFSLGYRLRGVPLLVALALLLAAEYVIQARTSTALVEVILTPLILVSAPALAGRLLARSHAQSRRLREMAADLEASRGRVAALSAEAERARMARDLHDVLGHTLSSIAVQAGAGQSLLPAGHPARAAVERIRQAAHEGLEEVRRVLADEHPAVHTLEDTAAFARAGGADVEVTGAPSGLPDDVSDACFRIVQEALTNARRHAPGAAVRVRLARRADQLVIEVVNDGPIGPARDDGRGLTGMRERVRACGGEVEAAPTAAGWQVRAWMPLPGVSA
jgi:signal transduction histidine kinase